MKKNKKISIIIPVYADWSSLKKNIKAVKKTVPSTTEYEVFYVNDCGPDADKLEKKIINKIKGRSNFYYFRNKQNLGFVKSCNNAVFNLCDQTSDVLLLNSDAVVMKGWTQELRSVLYAEKEIGAVCPRSNSATIFSVPMEQDDKRIHSMKESYKLYKSMRNRLPKYYISPIAHGFCMLIRREVIGMYGLFDEIYGKGYGEETDFCMRILHNGWKCAAANWTYVFHYESRSFTKAKRDEYVQVNEKILNERYPDYVGRIYAYVASVKE